MNNDVSLSQSTILDYYDILYSAVNRRCLCLINYHYSHGDIKRTFDWLSRFRRISGYDIPLIVAIILARQGIAFYLENEAKRKKT